MAPAPATRPCGYWCCGCAGRSPRPGSKGSIRTTQNGYVLDLGDCDASAAIDLRRFEALLVTGVDARARHDDIVARSLLTEALELWHGEPFAGSSECAALEPERARLTTSRLEAVEHLASTMIELGDLDSAAAMVAPLAGAHPERERLTTVLMLAHLRAGRPAEALPRGGTPPEPIGR